MTDTNAVLGLSLGTRKIGIAVIKNGDLKDWCVKEFKGPWNKIKLQAITFALLKPCQLYGINTVAIKTPKQNGEQVGLRRLILEMKLYAKVNNTRISYYSRDKIKHHYCGSKKVPFMEVIKAITSRKKELVHAFQKEQKNLNGYYDSMFEAVAVAILAGDETLAG